MSKSIAKQLADCRRIIAARNAALADPVPPADTFNDPLKGCDVCGETCAVPPVGGEVEVVGYWYVPKKLPLQGQYIERKNIRDGYFSESFLATFDVTELVDRAHVTRLQAEVAHQEAQHEAATRYAQTCLMAEADALAERDALRSELTKVRELNGELVSALEGMVEYFPEGFSDGEHFSIETAKAVLAHQSAPAAMALSAENQRIVPPEPIRAKPHPLEVSMRPGAIQSAQGGKEK